MEVKKKKKATALKGKRDNSGQGERLTSDCKTVRNFLKGWDPGWCASFLFVRGLDESGKKITRNNALGNTAIRKTESRLSMQPAITKIKKTSWRSGKGLLREMFWGKSLTWVCRTLRILHRNTKYIWTFSSEHNLPGENTKPVEVLLSRTNAWF